MDFSGKIIEVCQPVSGTSASGNLWKRQDYVMQLNDGNMQYPSLLVCSALGEERINALNIEKGKEMTISADFSARENGGRWFNDIRAWKAVENPTAIQQTPVVVAGKIIAVLDPTSGTSARGEWKRQDFVLEIYDGKQGSQYPSRVVLTVWGADKIQQMNFQEGKEYTVNLDVRGREYQGRWYIDIRAWKAVGGITEGTAILPQSAAAPLTANTMQTNVSQAAANQPIAPGATPTPINNESSQPPFEEDSDLPF